MYQYHYLSFHARKLHCYISPLGKVNFFAFQPLLATVELGPQDLVLTSSNKRTIMLYKQARMQGNQNAASCQQLRNSHNSVGGRAIVGSCIVCSDVKYSGRSSAPSSSRKHSPSSCSSSSTRLAFLSAVAAGSEAFGAERRYYWLLSRLPRLPIELAIRNYTFFHPSTLALALALALICGVVPCVSLSSAPVLLDTILTNFIECIPIPSHNISTESSYQSPIELNVKAYLQ